MTLETLVNDYKAKTSRSRQMYEEALRVMPGGNSRTTTFFDPYPFYITRGAGARVWDADGAERLDFNGNYTSLILGHAHPSVVEAVTEQATRGMSFPGPSEHEVKLAGMLTKRIPSMEVVRFTNSGTEATMNAVRAARAFTGRSKLAKFEGAYHGTHDWVLVSVSPDPAKAGSRKRPKSIAYSAGVPETVLKHTVVLPWNDAEACAKILEKHGGDIAALIVDPLMANAGLLVPQEGFLERLREVTARLGIVLIFDEVISFRVASGGAQQRFGVRPDLTTLGKIIGGGLAVGAFGGRVDVMNAYDPRGGKGRISHGGTFNANPVTMAGGVATMQELTPDGYARLEALGDRLRAGVKRALTRHKQAGQVTGLGSLFWIHWTKRRLSDYRSSRPADTERPLRTFMGLLNDGVLLTQRGLGCCSLAMTDADVDRFLEGFGRVVEKEAYAARGGA
jgi:glutamate-1-semialdehyde 2,1-aminomutase